MTTPLEALAVLAARIENGEPLTPGVTAGIRRLVAAAAVSERRRREAVAAALGDVPEDEA